MFAAAFLNSHRPNSYPKSKLFLRRMKMREQVCVPVPEPPSISPMTAALLELSDLRTRRSGSGDVSALITANAEPSAVPEAAEAKTRKPGRKRKNEMRDVAPQKPARRKNGGTRKRKMEPGAATDEPEDCA